MAVVTAKYALTNVWTDLGAGPMLLSFQGAGLYAVSDAQPTLVNEGFSRARGGSIRLNTTSHVWALAKGASGATAYAAPITPSGGAAWTPASLSGLVAWYDGQKAGSIILNGSTVTQWSDQSGHGYNAVQGTGSSQPTYNVTGLNGKPALIGSNATSLPASIPMNTFSSAITEYVVASYSVANTNASVLVRANSSHAAPLAFFGGAAYISNGVAADQSLACGAQSFTTPSVYGAVLSPANFSDFLNGTAGVNVTVTGSYGDGNVASLGILGQPGWQASAGTLGEAVLTSNVIAVSDRQKLEGYLAWKWGLQAKLPAGHPYKGAPP